MGARIAWQSAVRFLPALLLVVLAADVGHAQGRRTVLNVTGFRLTTTGTSVADFDAGAVAVGSTNFDINLTTTFVTIETRTATFNGTNDPWANSVAWRYALSYTGTPPRAATAYFVQFQLQVTAP